MKAAFAVLLVSVPVLPLVAALALALRPQSRVLRALAPWCTLPGLLVGGLLPDSAVSLPWVLQGTELALDDTGRALLLASAAIGWAAGIAVPGAVGGRTGRFLSYYLLVMAGSLGATLAADLLTFYLCFSLMSFAAYGLIVHHRTQSSRYAGRVYLTFVLGADMVLFAALVLIMQDTGGDPSLQLARSVLPTATHGTLALTLLIVGFGVKIGLLGLHVTLPLAYAAAPLPAAAVLAGLMVDVGLLGWIRLMPLGLGVMAGGGRLLVLFGVAAAFLGAAAGTLQRHPGALLGYSSISQTGIVTMAVGIGLMVDDGGGTVLAAVILYALHHAFAKAALFLGIGVAGAVPCGRRVLVAAGLLLPVLALAGAPLTTGMLAKETLKDMLSVAPTPWRMPLESALPAMALATTLVLARWLWLVWPRGAGGAERPARSLEAGWLVLVALSAGAAWMLPLRRPPELWSPATLVEVTWPVLLGALLAVAALRLARGRLRAPRLPPGDVLVIYRAVADAMLRAWLAISDRWLPALTARLRHAAGRLARFPVARAAGAAERRLVDWPVAVTLLLLAVLTLWLLPLIG